MPIYEYKCRGCGNEFEQLILPTSPDGPVCPSYQSQDLEQMMSAFSGRSEERSRAALMVARKQYERTELRDKKIAEREATEHHFHDQ